MGLNEGLQCMNLKYLLWDKKSITADFKMTVSIWNRKETLKIRIRTEIKKNTKKDKFYIHLN